MEATKPGTGPSPMEGTQDTLNSPSSELCHLPGEPITDSVPRVFTGGCSHWLPLPGTYQTSRLPTGKLMASINHAVCTNNPGAVSPPLSVRERVGGPSRSQASHWPAWPTGFSRSAALGLLCYHVRGWERTLSSLISRPRGPGWHSGTGQRPCSLDGGELEPKNLEGWE